MRLLTCGETGLLVELATLDEVLGLYRALDAERPAGVADLVPAARTLLVRLEGPTADRAAVEAAVRAAHGTPGALEEGPVVELEVIYDGEDLEEVARQLGVEADEVVARHTARPWTVAFCGFAPGFGYAVDPEGGWDVARRDTPRTRVPAGAVGLAGEFSGVYPRASPGGWQLVGRTDVEVFDLGRDPPALLAPGTRVQYVAR